MIMKNLLLLLIISFTFISCTDNTPPDVTLVTKEEMLSSKKIGFQWFNDTYMEYKPDTNNTINIKAKFNPLTHRFILFGKPGCSCGDLNAESFAQILKTLDICGVPEENIELFNIMDVKSKHPYSDILTIKKIPAYFVFKDNIPVYSIYDTLLKDMAKGIQNKTEFYLDKSFDK